MFLLWRLVQRFTDSLRNTNTNSNPSRPRVNDGNSNGNNRSTSSIEVMQIPLPASLLFARPRSHLIMMATVLGVYVTTVLTSMLFQLFLSSANSHSNSSYFYPSGEAIWTIVNTTTTTTTVTVRIILLSVYTILLVSLMCVICGVGGRELRREMLRTVSSSSSPSIILPSRGGRIRGGGGSRLSSVVEGECVPSSPYSIGSSDTGRSNITKMGGGGRNSNVIDGSSLLPGRAVAMISVLVFVYIMGILGNAMKIWNDVVALQGGKVGAWLNDDDCASKVAMAITIVERAKLFWSKHFRPFSVFTELLPSLVILLLMRGRRKSFSHTESDDEAGNDHDKSYENSDDEEERDYDDSGGNRSIIYDAKQQREWEIGGGAGRRIQNHHQNHQQHQHHPYLAHAAIPKILPDANHQHQSLVSRGRVRNPPNVAVLSTITTPAEALPPTITNMIKTQTKPQQTFLNTIPPSLTSTSTPLVTRSATGNILGEVNSRRIKAMTQNKPVTTGAIAVTETTIITGNISDKASMISLKETISTNLIPSEFIPLVSRANDHDVSVDVDVTNSNSENTAKEGSAISYGAMGDS